MTKPGIHHQFVDTQTASLEIELEEAREREKRLKTALHEVFPIDLYTRLRPDVESCSNGDVGKIVEHYVEHGINEIEIKKEILNNQLGLYEQVKEASSLLAEREKKLKRALHEAFPIDLYTRLRPDIESFSNGDVGKIVEHYVEYGINEIDIKKEQAEHANIIALKTAESCLRDIKISKPPKQGEEKLERKLAILKTKSSLSNLKENKQHDFAIQHSSLHYKSNTVCTWIPKNGCSSLRYSIAKENGAIANIDEIEWIHANNDCFSPSTKETLQADYAFTILRNPFKRLLSFYLDKLCHPQREGSSDTSRQNAQKLFRLDSNQSFSDFINYVWKDAEKIYEDEHTRPQCDYLLYRNYDDYYALEQIEEAMQKIQEKTKIKLEDVRATNSIFTSKGCKYCQDINSTTKASEIKDLSSQKKIPIVKNMYTADMAKKVATLYMQDILLYYSEIDNGAAELDYWIRIALLS